MTSDAIAVLIPIVAILACCGFAAVKVTLDYRNRREMFQLHHAERLAAIDKGVELPPLPPEFFQSYRRVVRGPAHYLRSGLLWLFAGGALCVALYQAVGPEQAWWGLLPSAVGAANLLFYFIAGRKLDEQSRSGAPPSKGALGPAQRLDPRP